MKLKIVNVKVTVLQTPTTDRILIMTPVKLPKWLIPELENYDSGDENDITILVYPDMIILEALYCEPRNIFKPNNKFYKSI